MTVDITDDLLAPEVVADPHSYFHALRAADPVHWNELHGSWVLTRYDDVVWGFRDPRLSADRIIPTFDARPAGREQDEMRPALAILADWMVFRDPPDHTRLRRLAARAFTAASAERLRPRVEAIVAELLDAVALAGRMDLVRDVAYPLPAIVIAELLGVPASDRDLFKAWSTDVAGLLFGALDEPDRYRRARRGLVELGEYFRELVRECRRRPAGHLIGRLVAAAEGLTGDEMVSTCTLLLFAGHETTTGLLGNGTLALLALPGELERLRREPALIGTAVEELLRYDGPAKVAVRRVTEDLELRGRRIRAGQRLLLAQAAANRDPERFPDPDRLDLGRADNPHVAFGHGIHHCLGAPLARLEAGVAFTALARVPGLRRAGGTIEWHRTILGRGLVSLPLAFDPR